MLGTAGTNVQAKCREVLRNVETDLKGETMNGVLALVSPGFLDNLRRVLIVCAILSLCREAACQSEELERLTSGSMRSIAQSRLFGGGA